jgi:hypothetical protein
MDNEHEIAQLKAQVEQLTAENAALREDGFRGSKAEALMALEYDRIPTFMKSQQAIAWQRKIATAVMIVVPLILVAVAVFGGFMPIGTISSSWKPCGYGSGRFLNFSPIQI